MPNFVENATKKRRARNCPECKSEHLVYRPEEECAVCLNCGFVVSAETAHRRSERKTNADQRKRIRISYSGKTDSSIKEKVANNESMVSALEHWKRVKIGDATEKNLALALQYTTKIAIDLSLPKIALEKASLAYKEIIEKKLVKGRSMRTLAATAVYIGCKQARIAVSTKDVAHVSGISVRKITRNYRLVTKQLNFKMLPTCISGHAAELMARLQVSERTIKVVMKITEILERSKLRAGRDPTGIACAAIYLSSMLNAEKRTQREIAEKAKITEATIRSRCREIENNFIFIMHL